MKLSLNDMNVKYCFSCNALHPLTNQYWYIKADGRSRCRARKHATKQAYDQTHFETRIVNDCKATDKKRNMYDAENAVTKESVLALQEKQKNLCYYCKNPMEYGLGVKRTQKNALTIERLDNTVGHTVSNCVLCHHKCQYINWSRHQ